MVAKTQQFLFFSDSFIILDDWFVVFPSGVLEVYRGEVVTVSCQLTTAEITTDKQPIVWLGSDGGPIPTWPSRYVYVKVLCPQ